MHSNSIGAFGHNFGQETHTEPHRRGEAETARIQRAFGVVFFIDAHLLEDGPGLFILGRQLFQVFIQMLAHLMFRRSDKAKADLVTDQAGSGADTKRQTIKQWAASIP